MKMELMAALLAAFVIIQPAGGVTQDSSAAGDESLPALKLRIERAYWSEDIVSLRQSAEVLEATGIETTDWHGGYYLDFIYRKLAEIVINRDKDRAKEYLEASVRSLERSLAIEPNAETYALLANSHGNRMGVTSLFGRLGVAGEAGQALERAVEMDSLNPRVLLVDGVSRIYRPGFAGGGYKDARRKFERALEVSIGWSETDTLMLAWGGTEDIYARWAELEIRNENAVNARRCIDYALGLRPEFVLASGKLTILLRELETRMQE